MRVSLHHTYMKRLLLACSTSVMTLIGSAPAQAAYKVIVSAESDGQVDYGRGYNAGNYRDGASGGPGYTFTGGTCASGQFSACSVGGSGTTSSNPNLTAATEATYVDSTTLPSSFFPNGLPVAASASAFANLANATVGIADSGTYGLSGCCSGQDGGSGASSAENSDVLHFNVAGASANTVTVIGVSYHVHGGMNAFTPLGDSTGDLSAILQLGSGFFEGTVFSGPGNGYMPVFSEAGQTGGWLTDSVTQNAPGDFTFNATYGLTGTVQNLGIVEDLGESCGGGTACDYAHTGTVSFTLPGTVSFTSDSGVFLTQPAGAVPEPASWVTMLAGFGIVGFTLRRGKIAARVRFA